MAKHNEFGDNGEKRAISYLIESNYEILETNWRYQHLEIDIIAQKNSTLIFIEVKTRRNNKFGEPYKALTVQKQKNILIAANQYIQKNEVDLAIQFDLITIISSKDTFKLDHYKEVFKPFIF